MVTFSTTSKVDVKMETMWKNDMTAAVNALVGNFVGGTFSVGGLTDGKAQIDKGVSTGQNVVKAAVFFTDGYANTVQDNLACGLRNYGGYDPGYHFVGSYCFNISQFRSQIDNTMKNFNELNVKNEAEYRSIQMANAMRAEGVTVYAIGLGTDLNKTFLQQVANDPASPTFDSSQPVGEADFAAQASDLNQVFQTVASKILLRLTR
jgi:hypothetical protein